MSSSGKKVKTRSRIKNLPPAVFEKMREQLLGGKTAKEVGKWLVEIKAMSDLKPETVEKYVSHYVMNGLRNELAEALDRPSERGLAGKTIVKSLLVIEEMTELAIKQKARVAAAMSKEKPELGLLMGTVSSEIDRFQRLLESLGRLQMDTGLLARAPKTLAGTFAPGDATSPDDPRVVKIFMTEALASRCDEVLSSDEFQSIN